jgi:hypothetical protein
MKRVHNLVLQHTSGTAVASIALKQVPVAFSQRVTALARAMATTTGKAGIGMADNMYRLRASADLSPRMRRICATYRRLR